MSECTTLSLDTGQLKLINLLQTTSLLGTDLPVSVSSLGTSQEIARTRNYASHSAFMRIIRGLND
jgi:hypothetical protein